jgi:hypothetical protein
MDCIIELIAFVALAVDSCWCSPALVVLRLHANLVVTPRNLLIVAQT